MIIVNPLYDRAFKILMENEKIAKLIISIIIEEEIESLQLRPREITIMDKKRNFPILRYDFKAIIKTNDNLHKVVLIEVQKAKSPDPIIRFRRYLASNYMKREMISTDKGEEEKALPIITIYFLGYNLPEYKFPAILVNNVVMNASTKEVIEKKGDFVDLLTHKSYILQVERLPEKRKTKLEKLLSLFDQAKKADEDYFLDLTDEEIKELVKDIKDFNLILALLNRAAQDEETRLQLELEQEVEAEFEKVYNLAKIVEKMKKEAKKTEEAIKEQQKVLKEKDKEVQEKQKALKEKDKEVQEKQKALKEKDKEVQEKQKALKEKDKEVQEKEAEIERERKEKEDAKNKLRNTAKFLKSENMSIDKIMMITGLERSEIENL